MTQAVRTPILTIPSETEQRLADLFCAQSTHIYIDTTLFAWIIPKNVLSLCFSTLG